MNIDLLIIYGFIFFVGLVFGYMLNFKAYQEKVLTVLDHLRVVSKTLDEEEYNYFKEKFISKENKVRPFANLINKIKNRGKKGLGDV